ncbi:hypothetical protein FNYG_00141 [Fusarium nygamai]|uniref:Uncharacterized protein n=1 Tax=Gibberella nygamai TaxID=42673 RepID=A0A2K0WVY7_GIBNY|nr:hypothetical protein FNYG_00141 [Fusarium nygamai]
MILKDYIAGPPHADQFLAKISPYHYGQSDGITNIDILYLPPYIVGSQNGFIWAAAEVFDTHRGLVIRVDDIWLAILALLKPHIYEAFDPEEDIHVPKFTREQLNNWPLVKKFWDQMLEADERGRLSGGWLSNFFDRRKAAESPEPIFDTAMPSAVASIPLEVDFGQGKWYCTMVGGLFAHSRDESGVDNYEYHAVEPLPGWLVYLDKPPGESKSKEATTVEVKGHR